MTSSRRITSLVTLAGGHHGRRRDRADLRLAARRPELPWTGPGDGAVPVDEDMLPRLALWLADVATEAAQARRALETDSPLADATPEQGPAPAVVP